MRGTRVNRPRRPAKFAERDVVIMRRVEMEMETVLDSMDELVKSSMGKENERMGSAVPGGSRGSL